MSAPSYQPEVFPLLPLTDKPIVEQNRCQLIRAGTSIFEDVDIYGGAHNVARNIVDFFFFLLWLYYQVQHATYFQQCFGKDQPEGRSNALEMLYILGLGIVWAYGFWSIVIGRLAHTAAVEERNQLSQILRAYHGSTK